MWANDKLHACPECGNKKVERMAIERLVYIK
jgi:ribosomal protein L37AE/L43A